MCQYYGGGAVRNEKTSWKGVCSFGGRACTVDFSATDLLRDLVRFLIADLLKGALGDSYESAFSRRYRANT